MRAKMIIPMAMVLMLLGVETGCSLFDRPIRSPSGRTADQLYKEGISKLNQRNYREAIETFYKLKYNFPAEAAAMMADLKIADAYYAKKDYAQAIESYNEFRRLHPTSPYMPYVIYMLGLCHYRQMLSIDRDQTHTRLALNEFKYVVSNYPNTPYAYDAGKKALECMKRLSAHEVYVGNFYYKKKKYRAAIARYETALKRYAAVPVKDNTLYSLADCYRKTNQPEKAQQTLLLLIDKYPKSKYARKARELLNKWGYRTPVKVMNRPQPNATAHPRQPAKPKTSQYDKARATPPQINKAHGDKQAAPSSIVPASVQIHESKPPESKETKPVSSLQSRPLAPSSRPAKTKDRYVKTSTSQSEDSMGQPQGQSPSSKGTFAFAALKGDEPINITADRMDAFQSGNKVIFEGNVVVRQKDVYLYARRITAQMAPNEEGGGIKKIEALGDVRITQGEKVATCEKAEFDNISKTIRLSGRPKLWQGMDRIAGERVLVQLDKEKMTVIGSDRKRVSAVIYPKEKGKGTQMPSKPPEEKRQTFTAPLAKAKGIHQQEAPVQKKAPPPKGTVRAESEGPTTPQGKGLEPAEPTAPSAEPSATPPAKGISPSASLAEDEAAMIAERATRPRPKSPTTAQKQNLAAEAKGNGPAVLKLPEESISDFLERWRVFWEGKDLEGFISCYSERFRSRGMDKSSWRRYKKGLFDRYREIRVHVSNLRVKRAKVGFEVKFLQRFTTEKYMDFGEKTLLLAVERGKWRILREAWRALPDTQGEKKIPHKTTVVQSAGPSPERQALLRLIEGWRESWQNRDPVSYFSYYSKRFKSAGEDLGAFRERRSRHMLSSKHIQVHISKLKLEIKGNEATARFVQEYVSDRHRDKGVKALTFEKEPDGRWRIVRESWSPL